MSSSGERSSVLRSVTQGASDFLLKPLRLEELRNVWQHVVRRKRNNERLAREHSCEAEHNVCDEDDQSQRVDATKKRNIKSQCHADKQPRKHTGAHKQQQLQQAALQAAQAQEHAATAGAAVKQEPQLTQTKQQQANSQTDARDNSQLKVGVARTWAWRTYGGRRQATGSEVLRTRI